MYKAICDSVIHHSSKNTVLTIKTKKLEAGITHQGGGITLIKFYLNCQFTIAALGSFCPNSNLQEKRPFCSYSFEQVAN